MHEYFLSDLARATGQERQRQAGEHRLSRAARKSAHRSVGVSARVRTAFRFGPVTEPVRPARPRIRVLVRQVETRKPGSRRVA